MGIVQRGLGDPGCRGHLSSPGSRAQERRDGCNRHAGDSSHLREEDPETYLDGAVDGAAGKKQGLRV